MCILRIFFFIYKLHIMARDCSGGEAVPERSAGMERKRNREKPDPARGSRQKRIVRMGRLFYWTFMVLRMSCVS